MKHHHFHCWSNYLKSSDLNLVVDTLGEEDRHAEEGGFYEDLLAGSVSESAQGYWWTKQVAALSIDETKTLVWDKFCEALETLNLLQVDSVKLSDVWGREGMLYQHCI